MAQIVEDLFLLLLDNASAQPGLDSPRRDQVQVLAAASLLDLAHACRVRPAIDGEPELVSADRSGAGGNGARSAPCRPVRPPTADARDRDRAAIVTVLHAVDGIGALLSRNDRRWRWVHARAGEIASGSWVDESPTALPEVNLAVTASAVCQALVALN